MTKSAVSIIWIGSTAEPRSTLLAVNNERNSSGKDPPLVGKRAWLLNVNRNHSQSSPKRPSFFWFT